jgi:predicted transcriptional regulator
MNDFKTIVSAVADAAGIPCSQVMSKRKFQETIDARWAVVRLMREEGFYSSKIADLLGMTTRNVNYILFSVETRLAFHDKAFSHILEEARKKLGSS